MFAKFYAARRPAAPTPAIDWSDRYAVAEVQTRAALAEVWAAYDNATGHQIARGTQEEMADFQRAFGLCHIAPAA